MDNFLINSHFGLILILITIVTNDFEIDVKVCTIICLIMQV
jgi:hypothetical protein